MKQFLTYLLLAAMLGGCATKPKTIPTPMAANDPAPAYKYPIENPYAATIIGLPQELKEPVTEATPIVDKTLVVFKDRKVPEGFWYDDGLRYGQMLQPGAAPIIFIIAGTGASYNAQSMRDLGEKFFRNGFHVVLLPSTTHSNFIVSASETFIPGRPQQNAEDLYRVMKLIDAQVRGETGVTDRYIIGYSLGAMDAAFTAHLDESEKALNFKRVLLINPPYNLYSSINIIDGWLTRGLPGGIDGLDHFIDTEMARLSVASASGDALDFSNARLLIEAYTKYPAGDERLATIIGLAFRIFGANMMFTSDVMAHTGYIFPPNVEFRTGTSLNDYLSVALRTSFVNYFEDVYAKQYGVDGASKQDLVKGSGLDAIGDYLSSSAKVGMITNADDIILGPGELQKMTALFGSRAKVFPNGGHLGNLSYAPVSHAIVHFVLTGSQE